MPEKSPDVVKPLFAFDRILNSIQINRLLNSKTEDWCPELQESASSPYENLVVYPKPQTKTDMIRTTINGIVEFLTRDSLNKVISFDATRILQHDKHTKFHQQELDDATVEYRAIQIAKDLPLEVTRYLMDYVDALIMTWNFANREDPVIAIDDAAKFDQWLGDDPHPVLFQRDLVLVPLLMDTCLKVLAPYAREFHLPIPADLELSIFFTISNVNKETISLRPYGSLISLLRFSYETPIDSFRQLIQDKGAVVFSSTSDIDSIIDLKSKV